MITDGVGGVNVTHDDTQVIMIEHVRELGKEIQHGLNPDDARHLAAKLLVNAGIVDRNFTEILDKELAKIQTEHGLDQSDLGSTRHVPASEDWIGTDAKVVDDEEG
jgi:hypothetical protein